MKIKCKNGFYGDFGGAYVPEILYNAIDQLAITYQTILDSIEFKKEFENLLRNYVGRPTPLYHAKNLSKKYGATILLKREDLNHTGAHKINNAIGQALIAKKMGKSRIIAETGAGQHGVAVATVCALLNLKCIVYMGEVDVKRQQPNVNRMKMLGAQVIPVNSGSKTLKDATNEAIRNWINNEENTFYIIGSVVGPHPYPELVTQLQSVISAEIKNQLVSQYDCSNPDYVIACVGGGSNAAGAFYHFIDNGKTKLIGVEAGGKGIDSGYTAATLMVGKTGIIHGSKTILMQDSDGQITEPHSISAGLDYPGIGPLHAYLHHSKKAKYLFASDSEALEAAFEVTKLEGIIPALESAHAFAALEKIKFAKTDIVVVNLSGRGDKDLETYINALTGRNYEKQN